MSKKIIKTWRIKDKRPIHDGDCYFWSYDLCTCGLLHHLMFDPPDEDWFWEEKIRHRRQLERMPDRLPYKPPTDEEKRQAEIMVNKLIKQFDNKD